MSQALSANSTYSSFADAVTSWPSTPTFSNYSSYACGEDQPAAGSTTTAPLP